MTIKTILGILIALLILTGMSIGQKKAPKRKAAASPSLPKAAKKTVVAADDSGKVVGRTYTNTKFEFEVTFPDSWLIPDSDFEAYMKAQGFDLSLKAPDTLPAASRAVVNASIKRLNILLTAYRSMPGMADNAIVRICTEDLKANPQIKDAVDYFDAMRNMYSKLQLPADFKYSETQAEKLGKTQFAYLDADSDAGKKRMYATVRNGYAIMFTISYTSDADLQTLRDVLAEGNFYAIKPGNN